MSPDGRLLRSAASRKEPPGQANLGRCTARSARYPQARRETKSPDPFIESALGFVVGNALTLPDLPFAASELGPDVQCVNDVIHGCRIRKGFDDLLGDILLDHIRIIHFLSRASNSKSGKYGMR